MLIAGVVLAAGRSSRLGRAKQLLPFDGKPLLQHVVDAACASRLDDVIVVLGQEADEVASALHLGRARLVVNHRFAEGQSTSIHRGLESAEAATEAALILLGDQPGIISSLIDTLVEAYRQGSPDQRTRPTTPQSTETSPGARASRPPGGDAPPSGAMSADAVVASQARVSSGETGHTDTKTGARRRALIVAPRYTDGIGNPVLFDRALWPELFAIRGDTGARDLLRLRRSDILEVLMPRPRLADVDTWEDYERLAPDAR